MAHKFDKTCLSETYPDFSVMMNTEIIETWKITLIIT